MIYAHLPPSYFQPDPCGLVVVICDYEQQPASVEDKIRVVARRYHVNEGLAVAIAWCESRFDPNATNPHSTARGVFQFLRGTANETGRRMGNGWTHADMFNEDRNIEMAMWLMNRGEYWRWACYNGD